MGTCGIFIVRPQEGSLYVGFCIRVHYLLKLSLNRSGGCFRHDDEGPWSLRFGIFGVLGFGV